MKGGKHSLSPPVPSVTPVGWREVARLFQAGMEALGMHPTPEQHNRRSVAETVPIQGAGARTGRCSVHIKIGTHVADTEHAAKEFFNTRLYTQVYCDRRCRL